MAVKPSDLAVKALKPRASGEYEVAVAGHRGLVVTVHPSGDKTWTYRTRIDGRLYRERIGPYPACSFAEATRRFTELRAKRKTGVDLPAERQRKDQEARKAPTVAMLATEYLDRHAKPNKRTWPEDEAMLNRDVLPAWGRLKAESITRRDVTTLIDKVADRGAPMQAGKVLALVRKLFNFGIERGALEANPATRIPRPAKARSVSRVLSDDQLRKFWNGLPETDMRPQVIDALRLQLLTGQRIGEVLGMEWSEVDLDKATWFIPGAKAKNSRDHVVPLAPQAVAILNGLPHDRLVVFPSSTGERIRSDVIVHEVAKRAVPKLGIGKFTTHDLRRTVETRMAELGIPKETRDRVLNHLDPSVGSVHYNRHDYMKEKRNALNAWAERLDQIVSGKDAGKVVRLKDRAR